MIVESLRSTVVLDNMKTLSKLLILRHFTFTFTDYVRSMIILLDVILFELDIRRYDSIFTFLFLGSWIYGVIINCSTYLSRIYLKFIYQIWNKFKQEKKGVAEIVQIIFIVKM
jgi:hypothetical protein